MYRKLLRRATMLMGPFLCIALSTSILAASGQLYRTGAGTPLPSKSSHETMRPTAMTLPDGELINDGSFENAPTAWSESSAGAISKIINVNDQLGISAYDGANAFWVGGYANGPDSGYVEQTLFLPKCVLALKFRAIYYRTDPDDPSDADYFRVSINGTQLFSKEMNQANETYPLWIKEIVDISAFANQTVTLRFEGQSAGALTGNVFVDYITMNATIEQPLDRSIGLGLDAYENNPDGGIYIGEDFYIEQIRSINAFWIGGIHPQTPNHTLADATALNFEIYADHNGAPDGWPGGDNPPLWRLSVPPSDPRVTLSHGVTNISDAAVILYSPVILSAGYYWLVFYPSMNAGDSWRWHVSDHSNEQPAKVISPGGLSGLPTAWTAINNPGAFQTSHTAVAVAIETHLTAASDGGGGAGCFITTLAVD